MRSDRSRVRFHWIAVVFAAWHTLINPTQWTISTIVWLGAGFAAILAAAARHYLQGRA